MKSHPKSIGVLRRLRTAVNKVQFLLRNLSSTSWPLISVLRSTGPRLRLSINDRRPSGLIEACEIEDSESEFYYEARSTASSTASTPSRRLIHRAASLPKSPAAGDEDIDSKADDFIENFYKQLRFEKQVSLELRYCRGYSFESSDQISPLSNLSLTSPTTSSS